MYNFRYFYQHKRARFSPRLAKGHIKILGSKFFLKFSPKQKRFFSQEQMIPDVPVLDIMDEK